MENIKAQTHNRDVDLKIFVSEEVQQEQELFTFCAHRFLNLNFQKKETTRGIPLDIQLKES